MSVKRNSFYNSNRRSTHGEVNYSPGVTGDVNFTKATDTRDGRTRPDLEYGGAPVKKLRFTIGSLSKRAAEVTESEAVGASERKSRLTVEELSSLTKHGAPVETESGAVAAPETKLQLSGGSLFS